MVNKLGSLSSISLIVNKQVFMHGRSFYLPHVHSKNLSFGLNCHIMCTFVLYYQDSGVKPFDIIRILNWHPSIFSLISSTGLMTTLGLNEKEKKNNDYEGW